MDPVSEVTEVAKEEEAEEGPPTPPPTPSPKPRKKAVRISQPPTQQPPVPTLDADFWASMLTTKRQMDLEATRTRYSNLVVFK